MVCASACVFSCISPTEELYDFTQEHLWDKKIPLVSESVECGKKDTLGAASVNSAGHFNFANTPKNLTTQTKQSGRTCPSSTPNKHDNTLPPIARYSMALINYAWH